MVAPRRLADGCDQQACHDMATPRFHFSGGAGCLLAAGVGAVMAVTFLVGIFSGCLAAVIQCGTW